jgi:hypothetical protein
VPRRRIGDGVSRWVDRLVIVAAVLTGAAMLGYLWWAGRYYLLPLWDRPDTPLHALLRPSGRIGHPLGWVGAALIIIGVIIYSSRKRAPFLQRRGPMRTWLNVHIYLCLVGPLLVTYHSALKLHGVAVYSYWSMMIVASSGIFGRWLYQQFPRTTRDQEMSVEDMRTDQAEARRRMETEFHLSAGALAEVDALAERSVQRIGHGVLALPKLILDDLTRPLRLAALRRHLQRERKLPRSEAHALLGLLRRRVAAERRIAYWGTFRRFFTYWHVTHLIFFVSMFSMLVLHVASVLFFGAVGNR